MLLVVYVLSTVFFYDHMPQEYRTTGILGGIVQHKMNATDFGVMCISNTYSNLSIEMADSRDNENQPDEPKNDASLVKSDDGDKAKVDTSEYEEKPEPVVFGDDPVVLIVHTHATESYLPASGGNYHTKAQENSVRDVGEVLAKTLEDNGIAAVHDQTLHDSPSYNQSYSRSYETIEKLLKKYPTIECVIDLHRDAIASESTAATVSVSGKKCAKYSYVVSNAVETYNSNLKFIKNMNKTAANDFSGFTGKVLERGYRYNQNLSSKYMLLEIGYNRNDIEESRNTAKIFGQILAETLKAGY